MRNRVLHLAIVVSTLCFVASTTWLVVAASTGRRLDYNFFLHPHSLALSGGRTVTGTSGYSLCTGRDGVQLFYTDGSPIVTREVGPDGIPLAGCIDVSIDALFELSLLALALIAAAAGLFVAVLGYYRLRHRCSPAVPIGTLRSLPAVDQSAALGTSAAG